MSPLDLANIALQIAGQVGPAAGAGVGVLAGLKGVRTIVSAFKTVASPNEVTAEAGMASQEADYQQWKSEQATTSQEDDFNDWREERHNMSAEDHAQEQMQEYYDWQDKEREFEREEAERGVFGGNFGRGGENDSMPF